MRTHLPVILVLSFGLPVLAAAARPAPPPARARAPRPAAGRPAIDPAWGRLPLAFEPNRGQTDGQVRFLARGRGYTLFLTRSEAVVAVNEPRSPSSGRRLSAGPHPRPLSSPTTNRRIEGHSPAGEGSLRSLPRYRGSDSGSQSPLSSSAPASVLHARGGSWRGAGGEDRSPASTPPSVLRLRLLGANPQPRTAGEAPLPGKSHYFMGSDPKRWRTNVPQFAKVRHHQVYPGIDLVYYGNQEGRLEYDFELAPSANPEQIRLAFSGAKRTELAPNGDLLLHTASGTLRQRKPIAYQMVGGERRPVAADYSLVRPAGGQGRRGAGVQRSTGPDLPCTPAPLLPCLRFRLGPYDRTRPVVIDPVLVYSTYLGGSGQDHAAGIATDAAGNTVVAGRSSSLDFPTTPGAPDTTGPGFFLTKVDPTGSSILFSTYLGGRGDCRAMALDAAGNAYLAGETQFEEFPLVNPVQDRIVGGYDAYLAKLNSTGSALLYGTYLGGADLDVIYAVAADAAGNACITGKTLSANFPTANPLQASRRGGEDAFVAKLPPGGGSLLFSTYLGGSVDSTEFGYGIAVDGSGSIYVSGGTGATDFPTTAGAFDRVLDGPSDVFVAKLNAAGSALVYSTFLGGSGREGEFINHLAVMCDGRAVISGVTDAADFPTTPGAFDRTFNGEIDGFVARLDSGGAALEVATYLGGTGRDLITPVAMSAAGNLYLAGETNSADFPLADPIQAAYGGGLGDGWAAVLDSSAGQLLFSTYLGGGGADGVSRVAVDAGGGLQLTGVTWSPDFPTAVPLQPALNGPFDTFLVKFGSIVPPAPPAAPSNLTATAISQTRIDLAWQDNAANESGFRVERWNGSVFAPIATVGANATTFSNTGLAPATTYLYRVLAFNGGGNSPPSNTAEATTLPNPPAAPSNLVATALSQTEIRLAWNENASNEDGIEVWRSAGGPFALHAGLGPNQNTYLDQNLTANTLYVYQVRAVNQGGNSAFSNQAGATTLPNPPAAPSGLTATAVSGSQIDLAWGDNSSNELDFVLEVSSDGGATFAFLATRGANTTTHSHTGLAPETTRHYRVKARNAGGDSAWSNVAFATTLQVPPATPTNLTTTALSSSEIRLTWNDVSGEQGYRIERRQANDPFAFVANVGANVTTQTDGGLQANKVYVYRVLAFNQAGDSGWSNEASARTLRDLPHPPHSLTAAAISATQVDLAWGDDNEDEQGFILERSENAGATWSQVASLPANVTRGSDTSAQGGKNYQYRLKAWNLVGESPYSNIASASTPVGITLASLTVSPASVRGGRSATGRVTLTGPAPAGGLEVTLASNHLAAGVPASVTLAAGATQASFPVTTRRINRNVRVTLRAHHGAAERTATLRVQVR